MTRSQSLWLAGVIWLGLGIAADKLLLTIVAACAFAASIYVIHKDRTDG